MNQVKQAVTEAEIINAQVNQIAGSVMNLLRKGAFPAAHMKQVLEMQENHLLSEISAVFDKHVAMVSKMLIVNVKVDRSKSADQMLKDSSDKQFICAAAVESMPQGEKGNVEVFFFPIEQSANDDMVAYQYELRGLKPADPYTLAAVNESRLYNFPMGTHWKNEKGEWMFMVFDTDHVDNRSVGVQLNPTVWTSHWWMAGVRK